MTRDRAYFLVRRLHSLTGIVPVGAFLLAHLYINSGALLGECNFTDGVRTINGLPYLPWIEIFGILLPLAFHGALGLWMAIVQARYNNLAYNYSRNWWYFVQRFTGLALVAFLGWHLWTMPLAKATHQMRLERFYGYLSEGMATDRIFLALFVVGVLAASFHFANGLWGAAASWGIIQSRKAQRIAGVVFATAGVAMLVVWLNIVYHFATGGAHLLPVQEPPVDCPVVQAAAID